ncbi:MAG: chromosome partitioning protein ParB, partial [Ignavibacteria bacterium]|nr:chromosome partitioning protein ParB [Ignavibacteria bacterium]
RQVERLVKTQTKRPKAKIAPISGVAPDASFSAVEDRFRQVLGTKVHVKPLSNGKGEIVLEYYSLDDLERLLELFDGSQDRSYV